MAKSVWQKRDEAIKQLGKNSTLGDAVNAGLLTIADVDIMVKLQLFTTRRDTTSGASYAFLLGMLL